MALPSDNATANRSVCLRSGSWTLALNEAGRVSQRSPSASLRSITLLSSFLSSFAGLCYRGPVTLLTQAVAKLRSAASIRTTEAGDPDVDCSRPPRHRGAIHPLRLRNRLRL